MVAVGCCGKRMGGPAISCNTNVKGSRDCAVMHTVQAAKGAVKFLFPVMSLPSTCYLQGMNEPYTS